MTRLVDLQVGIRAGPRRAAVLERAIGEIRRLCREADDPYVAGVYSRR